MAAVGVCRTDIGGSSTRPGAGILLAAIAVGKPPSLHTNCDRQLRCTNIVTLQRCVLLSRLQLIIRRLLIMTALQPSWGHPQQLAQRRAAARAETTLTIKAAQVMV
jgi:hypothetical protein